MNPTDEQRLIADTARQLFTSRGGPARFRRLRDAGDDAAYSAEVWAEAADLGWPALGIPEDDGGVGLGLAELAIVLEAAGRALAPEPLLASTVLGAWPIVAGGGAEVRARWLPGLASGGHVAALAWQEGRHRADPLTCEATATPSGEGVVLRGVKRDVLVGAQADVLVVAARHVERGDFGLWVVDGRADGVARSPRSRIDALPVAEVTLDGVRVAAADELVGDGLLERALDRGAIALAAELLGVASAAFELTLGWLRERKQFGVPIGSFQALQHRAARLYVELELCRSAVSWAARVADGPGARPAAVASAASLAKARCSDAARRVTDEAVQMHGGVGMTDEHDVGLYLKRARVGAATLGDGAWHRDRWARLAGY